MSWSAAFLTLLAFAYRPADAAKPHPENGVIKFITRPDIAALEWEVTYHDERNVAPGYWFVAPYEKIGERKPGGAWIGPHIYDGQGDLVWSGAYMWDDRNIMDFKLSNVRGEQRLTMMLPPDEDGLILDNHYQILEKVPVGEKGYTLNMHEFSFTPDGKSLLLMKRNVTHASRELSEAAGFDGECSVTFAGFEEIETTNWESKFQWSSVDFIPMNESTLDNSPIEQRCSGGSWDYLHSNALDKMADGHYLFSARHADTVYKIDKTDGHIIWRLGGKNNDFEMLGLNFSRQHHARFHEQNETHTVISLFDNSKGEDVQPATSEWSRALMIALRTDVTPMTAEIIRHYDHPYKEHAWRRGNYQVLPNGNAFICWSEHSLQSEHSIDGKLLWEARMTPAWIGTYRAFKYEFVGLPLDPPDVYAQAYYHDDPNNSTTTLVHVSWNGATEVREWILYKSDEEGKTQLRVTSSQRRGFETPINFDGYAAYVVVEGIDRFGGSLGKSKIIKTVPSDNMSTPAVEEELQWLKEISAPSHVLVHEAKHALGNPVATFFAGVIATAVVVFVVWRFRQRRPASSWLSRSSARYARVGDDAAEWDETKLDDIASSGDSHKPRDSGEQFQLTDDDDDEDVGRSGDGRLAAGRTPYVR